MTITLKLKYPSQSLNKNNQKGAHWSILDSARSTQKYEAIACIREQYAEFSYTNESLLWIIWAIYTPDWRRRDEDNLDLKGAQDGICHAIGVDDNQIIITTRCKCGKDPAGIGYIEVSLGEDIDEMRNILRGQRYTPRQHRGRAKTTGED